MIVGRPVLRPIPGPSTAVSLLSVLVDDAGACLIDEVGQVLVGSFAAPAGVDLEQVPSAVGVGLSPAASTRARFEVVADGVARFEECPSGVPGWM